MIIGCAAPFVNQYFFSFRPMKKTPRLMIVAVSVIIDRYINI